MNDFDKAEMKHDLEKAVLYYEDYNICLRCEENEAEPGEDNCEYCNDTIKHQNKERFQAEETW